MSDLGISVSQDDALRSFYDSGVVTYYSLSAAMESIVLRVASSDGGEPQNGEKYIVEFRHSETGDVLEILEEDSCRLFDSSSIHREMDELAEDYLRSVAEDWEVYVAQSGRCTPDEPGGNLARRGNVLQSIIRDCTL